MNLFFWNVRKLGAAMLLFGCGVGCDTAPPGPEKFPVQGQVRINGQPAERVAVLFHHSNPGVAGNLRFPTAVTDAEGRFVLSSEGEGDGAIEGEYAVTFSWLSSPDIDAFDMLGGQLADPQKSAHRVRVPADGNVLTPFELTISESAIRRPKPRPGP